MSPSEDFLRRWSRRKQEAAKAAEPAPAGKPDVGSDTPADRQPAEGAQRALDLTDLPPIESITATSDISAFLRAGVPADITRAALRRVWTSDPAIRDFVGLAENAWDFTDPNAMPGFGPLELTEEVRRMTARAIEQMGEVVQSAASEAALDDGKARDLSALSSPDRNPKTRAETRGARLAEIRHPPPLSNADDIAAQRDVTEEPRPSRHRGHGGALPRD